MGLLSLFRKRKKDSENSTVFSTCNDNEIPVHEISESPYKDNMSYMRFECNALFVKTNRSRKVIVETFSEEEAREHMIQSGFAPDSISIKRIPFDPPTPDQISAMRSHNNEIPENACKQDVSYLIEKHSKGQKNPDKKLLNFAVSQKVKFSLYAGEYSLYGVMWYSFDDLHKVAWYLLCVNHDCSRKWNFDKFDYYLNKAPSLLENQKFYNSFKRYINAGFYGFDGNTSRNTNCYKIALEEI